MQIIKWLKRIAFSVVGLYLAALAAFFVCAIPDVGPLGSAIVTYELMISGPLKRSLHSSVASDKEMIAQFKERRKEYERLAQLVVEKCPRDVQKTEALYQELKLIHISSGYPIQGYWMPPDPYASEAIKRTEAIQKEFNNKFQALLAEPIAPNERRSAEWVARDTALIKDKHNALGNCRYKSVGLVTEKYPYDDYVKGWVYVPAVPRVDDGMLQIPGRDRNPRGVDDELVLPNLDYVLGFWRSLQMCRYRQVEPQWFLFVCENSSYQIGKKL